jgi:glycosyltransferase involved in cell wall biosynthesis
MKKLKILIITQAVWNPRFGAVKVHIDIKEEYERQGHKVDKISFDDLYPNGQTPISKIFGKLYTLLIFDFLKKNAYKYDVIDANFSCVPFPKDSFNFKGVLLFRSHGIGPVYHWSEQNIERYKKALDEDRSNIKIKTRLGDIYRSIQKKAGPKEFQLSIKHADLVHCLNKTEFQYFRENGVPEHKLVLLPNGIPDDFIDKMNLSSIQGRANSLCFIGAWNVRKGIKDMNEIISIITQSVDIKEVILLGGQHPKKAIESSFDELNKSKLKIIPDFDKTQLLKNIESCKVGMFPSYVEGHPLAIIEQLSIGIPVVAYKVPGSTDILEHVDKSLLITPGDTVSFSKKIIELLQLEAESYRILAEKCKSASRLFLLSKITSDFVNSYYNLLRDTAKDHNYSSKLYS